MTPSWIVPAFNKPEHTVTRIELRVKPAAIKELTLERREETLTHRIIEAVAHAAHRGTHSGRATAQTEGERGVLAALVGVMNHADWLPLLHGHVQGFDDQLASQVRRHSPAHDPPAPDIQHDREVERTAAGR